MIFPLEQLSALVERLRNDEYIGSDLVCDVSSVVFDDLLPDHVLGVFEALKVEEGRKFIALLIEHKYRIVSADDDDQN